MRADRGGQPRLIALIALVILAGPVLQPASRTLSQETPGGLPNVTADKGVVLYRPQLAGDPLQLPLNSPHDVEKGDGVNVSGDGRAALRFGPYLLVHIFRNAGLQIQAECNPDRSVVECWHQDSGATVTHYDAQAQAGQLVVVRTDWAEIVATGTTFLVYHDPATAITWVVVGEGTVQVTADGLTVDVPAGMQTWVEPHQQPLQPFPATRSLVGTRFPSLEELTGCPPPDPAVADPEALDAVVSNVCSTTGSPQDESPTLRPTPTLTPTPTSTPTPTQTPKAVLTPSARGFAYGTLVQALAHAPLARDAGFTHMWAYLSWKGLEPRRGDFLFEHGRPNDLTNILEAAGAAGLRVIIRVADPPYWAGGSVARLNPDDVERYVYAVLRYGGGTIAFVEVFNELNLAGEWGASPNPAAYAQLLAGAYRGAKRANATARIVSAAPSQRTGGLGGSMEDVDWLEGLYAAGGAGSFDALGMHAYLGNFDPSTDPSCTPLCFRNIELYRAVMDHHGDGKPGLITEMGALEQTSIPLGQFDWMKLASDVRAEYLVKALQMANTNYPWLLGAMVFNLDYAGVLPATSERYWFGLLEPNQSPRVAYTRIQQARARGELP